MSYAKKHYPDVNPNPDFPVMEREILAYWKQDGTFKKSVDTRGSDEFVFYDGPPFANGLPHYGHLLTGFVKDAFARYQTQKGKKVERRFGWDCHGLPAEMGSEKELGITGRAAIQNFGIDKFNTHCRENVMKYAHEWENYVTRQARWVDFKNDYKTMDINFMESVLWAFKQLYDKGLIFEAHRVMPYSWAAETPLSNFETKLDNSYREREDKACTVAFELNTPPHGAPKADKYYVLAWTTTPWTLPSNLALAVNNETTYAYCFFGDNISNCYILSLNAKARYNGLFTYEELMLEEIGKTKFGGGSVKYEGQVLGANLIGLSYHPLFPYFASHKHSFKILDGSAFVTDGDGTGIVHMAPGFGEDDQKCCEANGIEVVVPVDGQGKFTDAIFDIEFPSPLAGEGQGGGYALQTEQDQDTPHPTFPRKGGRLFSLKGLNVIAEPGGSKFGLANDRIIDYLKAAGKLIKQEQIKHNYPHCWRTDQPLIYRAMPSWYVEVTKFRDRAAELNQQINWIPEHIRDGQMGHMLKTAPDWSISRNRFWGTPIPIWRAKSGKMLAVGSIKELEELSGKKVTDLHRPYIDEIKITKDGEEYNRVEDVFDCWFESGSMPFAQVHYPFENKDWFEEHFPADFITEYVGQTRGWFNTLIMLSTALFDKIPFKNCICHGVVLDAETGFKYSKRLKNYKDPLESIETFGADALRWLMLASPVMRGQDLMVDPEGKFIRDVVRLAIKPLWNAYNFFTLYANADGISAQLSVVGCQLTDNGQPITDNIMDSYIIAKCNEAVEQIDKSLGAYDSPGACEAVLQFFDALNNWYIRRNKERFWKSEHDADKQAAYDTLYTVLHIMCRAAASLLPLTCEEIYRGLTSSLPSPSGRGQGEGSFSSKVSSPHPNPLPEGEGVVASVHLAEFPKIVLAEEITNQSMIVSLMESVRDICNAGLAIRNKVNIRVRQPLKSLIAVGNKMNYICDNAEFKKIISDELNVKEIISDPKGLWEVSDLKISINSQSLGKRLPAKMKQILPASKKGEWEKTSETTIKICDEILILGRDYLMQLEPKPEYKDKAQALSSNDALVILDTTITPELEAEGIARDIVRMIQQARKDANLNVSDRIDLYLHSETKIMAAISAHQGYILEQTLANALLGSEPQAPVYKVQNDIDSNKINISFLVAK